MFLHADPMQLLGNMIFLLIFGESVEDSLGHLLTFACYLLCGIGATALQYAGDPQSSIPCIGASGAISGIMAIYVVLYFKVKMDIVVFVWYFELLTILANALVAGVVWVAEQSLLWLLQSSTGISFGIAFLAHVGGFVSGVGIAVVFSVLRLLKSQENKPQSPIRCPACQTQMNHWQPGRARCWSCRAKILIDKDGIVSTR